MKVIHWIGAFFIGLLGLYFVTSKKAAVRKVDSLQEEKIKVLASAKSNSLQKVSVLNNKIKKQRAKAKKAGERTDARIEALKKRDKSSPMADRIKKFNEEL